MSLPSEGQSLLANQILSRYLKWRLRYIFMAIQNGLGRGRNFFSKSTMCQYPGMFCHIVWIQKCIFDACRLSLHNSTPSHCTICLCRVLGSLKNCQNCCRQTEYLLVSSRTVSILQAVYNVVWLFSTMYMVVNNYSAVYSVCDRLTYRDCETSNIEHRMLDYSV